nr:MAG TPA: hypothetical protein [Caudoviricetes sp.]
MSKKLKLYEYQDESGTVLTAFPAIAEPHMGHCVVHVYDDPEMPDIPEWSRDVAAGLGVDVFTAGPVAVALWLIENRPGAVDNQLVRMHEDNTTPVKEEKE